MASVQPEAIFYNHYYFLQAFINALKIFSDSSKVIYDNSGCHCMLQIYFLSFMYIPSTKPSSLVAITSKIGAKSFTA